MSDLPLTVPYQSSSSYSALHLYPIQLDIKILKKSREQIFNILRESHIGVNVHYIPVHTQPYYLEMGFRYGDFPVAEVYYSKAISLPLFSQLSFDNQDIVVSNLRAALNC
jgi:dTDP-4-amino-4,6-dideoxygalactose transaminase